jgi:hypothetical protein
VSEENTIAATELATKKLNETQVESDSEASNSSIENISSDEESDSFNSSNETKEVLSSEEVPENSKIYYYRIIMMNLNNVFAGLAPDNNEDYKRKFAADINNALLLYKTEYLGKLNNDKNIQAVKANTATIVEIDDTQQLSDDTKRLRV